MPGEESSRALYVSTTQESGGGIAIASFHSAHSDADSRIYWEWSESILRVRRGSANLGAIFFNAEPASDIAPVR